jgi:uncharacterized RDD family membrane protein YckC
MTVVNFETQEGVETTMSESSDSVTYELADVGTRLIAIIIDGIILGVIGGVLYGIFNGTTGSGLSFLVGIAYNWYFWTRQNGQTPGKSVMKIRVIKTDGGPISDGDAILRYIGYYISGFVLALGYLWAIWDENHQGWHDKIANTYVVKA